MNGDHNRPTIVLGAGGHAKVVISTLQAAGLSVSAVYDNNVSVIGTEVLGVRVVGSIDAVDVSPRPRAVIAIGNPRVRRMLAESLDIDWLTVVHPHAWVHPSVVLGSGTIVFAGAVIQPETHIGEHCIINTGATVDHDCRLGDFVNIAPGCHLAGAVTIGAGTSLGIGSSVIPCITNGDETVIGAGAAVVRDIPSHVVAVGCPARVIREDEGS